MTNREKQLVHMLHWQESKNHELQGKLDRALGFDPGSLNKHYLYGYGHHVAIEAAADAMPF